MNNIAYCGLACCVCSEKDDLTKYGIERSSCIDHKRIEKIIGCPLDVKNDKTQRERRFIYLKERI